MHVEPALPSSRPRSLPLAPAGLDWLSLACVAGGLALLYVPAYVRLAQTIWSSDEYGHGPIILAVSFWLLYTLRHAIAQTPTAPRPVLGWSLLVLSLAGYAVGRSQDIIMFEIGSQIPALAALLLIFKGGAALRLAWFPLLFQLFMVPLPEALVAAVTAPLKTAVSAAAAWLLHLLDYPVGRSGVILTVGPYQMFVADACAGLNSMFTLEALGLLYMNLMGYTHAWRNASLAVLLVPIAFFANVIRVMVLVLVTYHFGDEAGQGFVHGFAGMFLFAVALVLMLAVDWVLGRFMPAHAAPVKS
jgi:exosortase B